MSDRYCAFCFGVTLLAVVLADVVSASGQTVELSPRALDQFNSKGTLVFGFRQELDRGTEYEPGDRLYGGSQNTRGALTLQPFGHRHSFLRFNGAATSPIRPDDVSFARLERPFSLTRSGGSRFSLQSEGGVTSMQIAFASPEGLSPEEITPVSEVGTGVAAPLAMMVIGYSQRRRLGKGLRGLLHKPVGNPSADVLPRGRLARAVSAG